MITTLRFALCLVAMASAGAAAAVRAEPVAAQRTFTSQRGMWVRHADAVMETEASQAYFFAEMARAGITDLYLYLTPTDYTDARLPDFIAAAGRRHIAVWGVDGCRCYFRDVDGPGGLYAAIDALIAYNGRASSEARFTGFQNITLPHDIAGYPATFHNGLAASQLDADAARDRRIMLADWLDIQRGAAERLHAHGLKAAAAMLSSTENYYGEPMTVTYAGKQDSVGHLMMSYVDDYIVLTYNTDPGNAAGRAEAQAAYASGLPEGALPRVFAALETEPDNGPTISYGDTPGKQAKSVVLDDMTRIEARLAAYPAFAGVSLFSGEGWEKLR